MAGRFRQFPDTFADCAAKKYGTGDGEGPQLGQPATGGGGDGGGGGGNGGSSGGGAVKDASKGPAFPHSSATKARKSLGVGW